MSLYPVPAVCPFSLGAASASCKHLPPPAVLWICIPLCPFTHLGGQGEVLGQQAASCSSCSPRWETAKSDEPRLAGGCACSVCSEAICTVCPIYFLIMWSLAQVPFTWNGQISLQWSSVLIALPELAQQACIWGACRGALSFIYFLNVHFILYYIVYRLYILYIVYIERAIFYISPSQGGPGLGAIPSGRMWPQQQDLGRGCPLSQGPQSMLGALWPISSYLLSQSWKRRPKVNINLALSDLHKCNYMLVPDLDCIHTSGLSLIAQIWCWQ